VTVLVEDTARNNLASWTIEAGQAGNAAGAIISPFSTPRVANNYKQSARQTVQRIQAEGLEVWFDPETHALQMPSVGDFRYYGGWPLWSGQRGLLADQGDMRDHVERVFEEQDRLGVPHLGPTILLHSPQSPDSQRALELAQAANSLDPDARLAVVGDSTFWASGSNLDAHVGALAQLEPGGWSLSVARSFTVLAAPVMAEEVHGLCRTARALSEDADVHISHGDLAGLPGVAAGATSLGTGWDARQRVLAYSSYEARGAGGEGGSWFQQTTLEGLLSLLVRSEADVLYAQDRALAMRLLPISVPPDAKNAFLHHVGVLSRVVAALGASDHLGAYKDLRDRYQSARQDWPAVAAAIGISSRADGWLSGPSGGLRSYGQTEGF
jgi:hypothetical protein